ncbi:MAG: drug/metabolite transporter (DMT)-like permease [Polaribacter sp.]|jgi:drug/metabolite transporter (DMT)-like permease
MLLTPTIKAHLALFAVALIYGANYTIAKEVLNNEYLQPLGFILMRAASACFLFWILNMATIKEKVERKDFGLLVLCGLTGIAINQMLFFSGLKLSQPINASLIMTTIPIMIIVIAPLLTKERITWWKASGVLTGAVGAVLLVLYGKSVQLGKENLMGDIFLFLNATSYGLYLVLVKKLMQKYHAFTVMKWVFTFGLLFIIPFGAPQLVDVDWSSFPTSIWLAIAYVLLFTTFFAYLFNAYALKIVSPTVAGIYVYLQPLLTTMVALWTGKDELTMIKVLAGMLIFFGVFLVTQKPK